MLTAMMAVENIIAGRRSKDNLWQVNTEQEYHEEKGRPATEQQPAVRQQPVRVAEQPEEKSEEVA